MQKANTQNDCDLERQRKKDAEQRQRVQDVASAKHWMQKNLHDEQESIQLRLGKIFERQMLEEGRSVRDIFMAFDEDGGGTIDRDELHDGSKVGSSYFYLELEIIENIHQITDRF